MNKLDEIEGKLGAVWDDESYLEDVLSAVPDLISKLREWENNKTSTVVNRPDISAIKSRLSGIPDAVWELYSYEGQFVLPSGERTKTDTASVCRGGHKQGAHECVLMTVGKDEEEAMRVANFAANARQDIPSLIAYVEFLEKMLGK